MSHYIIIHRHLATYYIRYTHLNQARFFKQDINFAK